MNIPFDRDEFHPSLSISEEDERLEDRELAAEEALKRARQYIRKARLAMEDYENERPIEYEALEICGEAIGV